MFQSCKKRMIEGQTSQTRYAPAASQNLGGIQREVSGQDNNFICCVNRPQGMGNQINTEEN